MSFARCPAAQVGLGADLLARKSKRVATHRADSMANLGNKNAACSCGGEVELLRPGPDMSARSRAASGVDFGSVPIRSGAATRDANSPGQGTTPSNETSDSQDTQAQPVDAGPAKTECPAANKATKLTGCVQPVLIADDDGKKPTAAPSFTQVQAIWKKCCIDYSVNAAKTVNKTAYKTLDESPDNTPTKEEQDLFKDAGTSSCIQVFVPVELTMGKETGKNVNGGGGTYFRGTANPKVVLVEGAVAEVVAHEVGHASGFAGHVGAGETIMKGTGAYNVANPTAVSAGVCSQARTGAVLNKAGDAKDCCIKSE